MLILEYILSLSVSELVTHLIGCYLLVLFIKFLLLVTWNLIKEAIPLNDILTKYTQSTNSSSECWAVITGATDGIGLGFAQILTQQGFDICLISRNQQKLNKTVQDLQKYRTEQHKNRKIMTIQFDFINSVNQQKFNQMIEKVKKLDIGILVNNVGTSDNKEYQKFSYEQIKNIININCTSMSIMTSVLITQIKARKAKSAIINLSSFAGQYPLPYVSLYSATKAMNTFFSEALSLQNPELDILSVRPMFVESPLSRQKKGFNVPDRRECALACLKQLRWQYETHGYVLHRILAKVHQLFVPHWLQRIVTKKVVFSRIAEYQIPIA